jgi:CheY-like chemotaxis protein
MNLVINAAEAVGEANGLIRVALTDTAIAPGDDDRDYFGAPIPPGRYVCLEVVDNGCGMDGETSQRVFEPFFTTKFTGRGLGMSATIGIITAHQGALQLVSRPGQGSTFRVYLPVCDQDPAIQLPGQPSPEDAWQGSGTVLLVEDNDTVRPLAVASLEMLGYTVITAVDGREALERFRSAAGAVTLVMTDIDMPVMDGYALIRELKALAPGLPVVVTRGFGDAEIAARIEPADIAAMISKPYRFDQLRDLLKRIDPAAPTA